jgi:hypothetical protein
MICCAPELQIVKSLTANNRRHVALPLMIAQNNVAKICCTGGGKFIHVPFCVFYCWRDGKISRFCCRRPKRRTVMSGRTRSFRLLQNAKRCCCDHDADDPARRVLRNTWFLHCAGSSKVVNCTCRRSHRPSDFVDDASTIDAFFEAKAESCWTCMITVTRPDGPPTGPVRDSLRGVRGRCARPNKIGPIPAHPVRSSRA